MQRIRFRIVLPIAMSLVSLLLFTWEYENGRVMEAMGMGWDTGPPIWPYRAVPAFSYALSAPAYLVSWPVIKLASEQADWAQYAIWLPVITVLWWWVGTRIDFGLLGRRTHSHPRVIAGLLLLGALILLTLSADIGFGEYNWLRLYWSDKPPIYAVLVLRSIGPILWCLLLARAFIWNAFHLWVSSSNT